MLLYVALCCCHSVCAVVLLHQSQLSGGASVTAVWGCISHSCLGVQFFMLVSQFQIFLSSKVANTPDGEDGHRMSTTSVNPVGMLNKFHMVVIMLFFVATVASNTVAYFNCDFGIDKVWQYTETLANGTDVIKYRDHFRTRNQLDEACKKWDLGDQWDLGGVAYTMSSVFLFIWLFGAFIRAMRLFCCGRGCRCAVLPLCLASVPCLCSKSCITKTLSSSVPVSRPLAHVHVVRT